MCIISYAGMYTGLSVESKAIYYAVGFRQSKTALFDWILLVLLLIVSRVDFIVFVLFLEAVSTTALKKAKSVGSSMLRAVSASNGSTNLRPSELVALGLAKSRQSYSRRSRCWQHGIETARCCRRVIHAAGERNYECATLTCCEKQQQG